MVLSPGDTLCRTGCFSHGPSNPHNHVSGRGGIAISASHRGHLSNLYRATLPGRGRIGMRMQVGQSWVLFLAYLMSSHTTLFAAWGPCSSTPDFPHCDHLISCVLKYQSTCKMSLFFMLWVQTTVVVQYPPNPQNGASLTAFVATSDSPTESSLY